MVRLLIRLACLLGLAYCGYAIGHDQKSFDLNVEAVAQSSLAGQLSACNQLVGAFKTAGQISPLAVCEVYQGVASIGYGRPGAPHFHLDGSTF